MSKISRKPMIVRKAIVSGVNPRETTSPTIINVKPYHIIMLERTILCDRGSGLPVVFNTRELAEFCIEDRGLVNHVIQELELEDIVHICRSTTTPFTKFMLITDRSQLCIY